MGKEKVNSETCYAPEVEEALVTLLWHKPDYLGQVLQKLDPAVHILQPHLRFILEAINLSYTLLGTTDFAAVVEALREDGHYEACGERVGLDSLYGRNYGYESLLGYYIESLKLYADKRLSRRPEKISIFTGGKGTLNLNLAKHTERAPDYVGNAFVRGRTYTVCAWTSLNKQALNLSYHAA